VVYIPKRFMEGSYFRMHILGWLK